MDPETRPACPPHTDLRPHEVSRPTIVPPPLNFYEACGGSRHFALARVPTGGTPAAAACDNTGRAARVSSSGHHNVIVGLGGSRLRDTLLLHHEDARSGDQVKYKRRRPPRQPAKQAALGAGQTLEQYRPPLIRRRILPRPQKVLRAVECGVERKGVASFIL